MVDDTFDLYRQLPSHQARLAAEKQVNCYFVPGHATTGGEGYFYAVCSALLHEQFVAGLRAGVIPDFAVVVETGSGAPTAEVKARIKDYYGFDHDAAEAA